MVSFSHPETVVFLSNSKQADGQAGFRRLLNCHIDVTIQSYRRREACERFGIAYGTARNALCVANAFELSLRSDNLSWHHHKEVANREDAAELLEWAAENIARRHLDTKRKAIFGDAWREHEQTEAKKRLGHNQHTSSVEIFPQTDTGKSRDKIGERVGVSGKLIDKVAVVKAYAPEKLEDSSTLEQAYREANARRNC